MNGINYKKGFTLIEVLIAIGILSIVLLSVYGTFFSVNRAVRFADSRVYRLREIRIFFDMIRKEIESAYLDPKDSRTFFGIKDRDIFGVQASELKFTSFVPYSAGLHYVEYGLDRKKLTLNKKIGVPWEAGTPEKVAVLNDVMGFKVETDNSGKWIGTYDTGFTKRLPSAVRVTLKFRMDGKVMMLEETIIPRLRG